MVCVCVCTKYEQEKKIKIKNRSSVVRSFGHSKLKQTIKLNQATWALSLIIYISTNEMTRHATTLIHSDAWVVWNRFGLRICCLLRTTKTNLSVYGESMQIDVLFSSDKSICVVGIFHSRVKFTCLLDVNVGHRLGYREEELFYDFIQLNWKWEKELKVGE